MLKKFHLLKIVVFLVALFGIAILTFVRPKQEISLFENRRLASSPVFSVSGIFNRQSFTQAEDYLTDHLFGRTHFLKLDTKLKMNLLHLPVANQVVITSQALLPFHPFNTPLKTNATQLPDIAYNPADMDLTIDRLAKLNVFIKKQGGQFLYIGIPNQSSIFRQAYPFFLDNHDWQLTKLETDFFNQLAKNNIPALNMKPILATDASHYYYQTDHHYNLLGAYRTYCQAINQLNPITKPVPLLTTDDIIFQPIDIPFQGSRNRKLFYYYPTDDKLYQYILHQPLTFERQDNGQSVSPTVFSDWAKNSYSYYMGGDIGETIIQTHRPQLAKVLIVGDSYTNAFETLAYLSFDEMRSLDFRHYREKNLYDYLEDYQPDIVFYLRDDTNYLNTKGNGNFDNS